MAERLLTINKKGMFGDPATLSSDARQVSLVVRPIDGVELAHAPIADSPKTATCSTAPGLSNGARWFSVTMSVAFPAPSGTATPGSLILHG
jgi:hypothetical protein